MLYFIIGYLALYFTIWTHEVGHSYMYKRYGCKENAFKVTVPFYLFFSTPSPVDIDKLDKLNEKQHFNISIAGMVVNFLISITIFIVLYYFKFSSGNLFYLFTYLVCIFSLLEAATYLTINNLFLASDMERIAQYNAKLRLPCFLIGSLAIFLFSIVIIRGPKEWQFWTIISCIIASSCMGLGRIVFTIINNKKS